MLYVTHILFLCPEHNPRGQRFIFSFLNVYVIIHVLVFPRNVLALLGEVGIFWTSSKYLLLE